MGANGKPDHEDAASEDRKSASPDPITRQLRDAYQSVANEPVPDELSALLERLKKGEAQ